jgi:hypothetical protein
VLIGRLINATDVEMKEKKWSGPEAAGCVHVAVNPVVRWKLKFTNLVTGNIHEAAKIFMVIPDEMNRAGGWGEASKLFHPVVPWFHFLRHPSISSLLVSLRYRVVFECLGSWRGPWWSARLWSRRHSLTLQSDSRDQDMRKGMSVDL